RRLQPERPRPHDGRRLLGAGSPGRHGLHADHVGRNRRGRTGQLHHGHRSEPFRRARRSPCRHRRRRVLDRRTAGVGGARRGGGRRLRSGRRRAPGPGERTGLTVFVGLLLDPFGTRWVEVRDAASAAVDAGFAGIWTYDHLDGHVYGAEDVLEGWTVLSALAAV